MKAFVHSGLLLQGTFTTIQKKIETQRLPRLWKWNSFWTGIWGSCCEGFHGLGHKDMYEGAPRWKPSICQIARNTKIAAFRKSHWFWTQHPNSLILTFYDREEAGLFSTIFLRYFNESCNYKRKFLGLRGYARFSLRDLDGFQRGAPSYPLSTRLPAFDANRNSRNSWHW